MAEKEYTVYFEGKMTVVGETEDEARQLAEEELMTSDYIHVNIKKVSEGECALCGGEGSVPCDETDADGNIERGVGTEKCICRTEKEADYEADSE
jgi:hypothetical protein